MYGIYNGSLVKIISDVGSNIQYESYAEAGSAQRDKVILLSEDLFNSIQDEHSSIMEELENIRSRIYTLDAAYHKKKNALYQLWMAAREKETSLVSRLIKTSQENCQK